MIEFATENNLFKLLPYLKMACPNYDFMLVWHKDGRYGFHIDPKVNIVDKFGQYRHFELLVKNDFELEINKDVELYSKVKIARFVKFFRMGMVAVLGYKYKTKLDEFLFQKQKGNLLN